MPGPDCGVVAGCPHLLPKYDEGGTALGTNTSIQYGSGSTEGENYVDDVTVAGLTSPNQTFFAATAAYGFRQLDADGICGMAFSSVRDEQVPSYPPFSCVYVCALPHRHWSGWEKGKRGKKRTGNSPRPVYVYTYI